MKKDIEWLEQRIQTEREQLAQSFVKGRETDDESAFNDGKDKALSSVLRLINQLDKPEVLSQELPEIPRFVADWIEDLKSKKINLLESIYDFTHGEDINDYMREQSNELMRAWLDGFTVKKEQRYYVINNDQRMMLVRMMDGKTITEADPFKIEDMYEVEKKSHRLTEQEIKDYDPRYWAFATPVEELEQYDTKERSIRFD